MSLEKRKFPAGLATLTADRIVGALRDYCERIEIAGSLRRRSPLVGDVEILFVAKTETVKADLFATKTIPKTDAEIERLLQTGVLGKRLNANGATMWGESNKLAVELKTMIPVDLFATTEAAWFNYLVCRTGPAELNVLIATRAREKGWRWNPYGAGFSRSGPLAGKAEVFEVKSEEDVFHFVGLEYCQPAERKRFER